MDISRVPNERKLSLCKKYFQVGFLCLPFVWAVNTVWFFSDAFLKPEYEEQKVIRKYVIMSGAGALAWFVAIVAWVVVYAQNRTEWGEFGDYISLLIPMGSA